MSALAAGVRRRGRPPWQAAFGFVVLLALAPLVGALAATNPKYAVGLLAAGLIAVFAFRAPVANLLVLIFWTAILPGTVQSRFGAGGGSGAGIVASDLFLLFGLAWAATELRRLRLDTRAVWALGLTSLFIVLSALQVYHAIQFGRQISGVGGEFRSQLAFASLLIALPILSDARLRARLLKGLVILGLLLGIWGIAQFTLGLKFAAPVSTSAQPYSTGGHVVGLFAFPIAALVSLSVLTSGQIRSARTRWLLVAVSLLNLAALILTFERSFFVTIVLGVLMLIVRAPAPHRLRLLLLAPLPFVAVVGVLVFAAPQVLSAYEQRILSLGSYQTDASANYRIAESRVVSAQIARHPITGNGFGADILIGRPGTEQPIIPRRYAESGVLWLAWKMGWPSAAVIWLLMLLAIIWPARKGEDPSYAAVRLGCQAGVFTIAVVSFTWSTFSQTPITPLLGVVLGMCAAPAIPAAAARWGDRRSTA